MALGQKVLYAGVATAFCILLVAQSDGSDYSSRSGGYGLLPPELLRPQYGEEPVFPQDYVIGKLGRCDASEESYRYARLITAGLAAGNGKADGVQFPEQKRLSALKSIAGIGTRSWRVGGGRVEPDGSYSFLVRFLGREKSITGELYLRNDLSVYAEADEDEAKEEAEATAEVQAEIQKEIKIEAGKEAGENERFWRVDDILLELPRGLAEGKFSPSGTDMTPYERFF